MSPVRTFKKKHRLPKNNNTEYQNCSTIKCVCVCFVVVDCAAVAAIIRGANSRVYSSGVLHYYVHALKIGLMPKTSKASHLITFTWHTNYHLVFGFFLLSLLSFVSNFFRIVPWTHNEIGIINNKIVRTLLLNLDWFVFGFIWRGRALRKRRPKWRKKRM